MQGRLSHADTSPLSPVHPRGPCARQWGLPQQFRSKWSPSAPAPPSAVPQLLDIRVRAGTACRAPSAASRTSAFLTSMPEQHPRLQAGGCHPQRPVAQWGLGGGPGTARVPSALTPGFSRALRPARVAPTGPRGAGVLANCTRPPPPAAAVGLPDLRAPRGSARLAPVPSQGRPQGRGAL